MTEDARLHYARGLDLYDRSEIIEAEKEFTKALEASPEYVDARFRRALTRYRGHDSDGAFDDIIELLLKGISSKEVFTLMAHLMIETGPPLCVRKAIRTTTTIGVPNDILDATLPSRAIDAISDLEKTRELDLTDSGDEQEDDIEVSPIRRRASRYDRTEIVEGQVKRVATFRSTKKLSDIVGLDKVKVLIDNNVILALKNPKLFVRYKKKPGFALLLYGPPGCGKTLLAEALAGEIDARVVVARIHELIDMYSGNSEKNIHALFKQALEIQAETGKPVIIFIDEIDALGVKRDGREDHQSMRLAVNQLLMEMDGLEKTRGLIIIGATNQPWAVDPALKRSGRFGHCIYVPPPDREQRKRLFEKCLNARPVEKQQLDLDELALLTHGYSAADIERIVETAIEKPMQRENKTGKHDRLKMQDILEVLEDKELGTGTLDEWFTTVAREIEREPRDKIRFKPLLDDVKEYLERKRSEEALRETPMAV